jgi:hypothetical protein
MAKSTKKNEKRIKKMINILETIRQVILEVEKHMFWFELIWTDPNLSLLCFLLRTVQCLKEPENRVEAHVIYTETPYDLRV